jgi:hypothetical protein
MVEKQTAANDFFGEQAPSGGPSAEDAYAQALLREREGYVMRGRDDRVAEVDAELERLGVARLKPASAPRETALESKPRRTAGRGGKAE